MCSVLRVLGRLPEGAVLPGGDAVVLPEGPVEGGIVPEARLGCHGFQGQAPGDAGLGPDQTPLGHISVEADPQFLGEQMADGTAADVKGLGISFFALDWIGYAPKLDLQSAGTIFGFKILCVLLPAAFILGSWAAFKFVWNITPEKRAAMAAMKQAKGGNTEA